MTRTCKEVIEARKIDEKKAIYNLKRKLRDGHRAEPVRQFPEPLEVAHRALVETQAPGTTIHSDRDGVSFSSPSLTRWYVENFCRLNGLVGGH